MNSLETKAPVRGFGVMSKATHEPDLGGILRAMNRPIASCIAAALVSFGAVTAHAQTPASVPATPAVERAAAEPALLAEDVLQRWITRSTEVASMRSQVRSARFDVITATIFPNPSVQVSFMGTPVGAPPDSYTNYGLQWSQPLPVFGQIGGRRQAAVAALSVTEVSVANALWGMAADLTDMMVQRAFAQATVEMNRRNLDELTHLEEIISRRVAAGANSQYDALRVRVSESTMRAALENAIIDRDRANARLVAQIADPTVTELPVTREGLAGFRGPEDLSQLLDLAVRRRPDLELARRGIVANLANETRWRRENRFNPSVSLGVYAGANPDGLSVQAGVSIPLPAFDRNQGNIGRARNDADGQRLLAEAIDVRIRRQVTGAWNARASARTALGEFRERGMAATDELVRRALVTFQAGNTAGFNIQDLFDAYRTMWDARSQEIELERTYAEAEADLERAVALVVP